MSGRNYRRRASPYGEAPYEAHASTRSSSYGEVTSGPYSLDKSASYSPRTNYSTRKSTDEGAAMAIALCALGLAGTIVGVIIGTYYGLTHDNPRLGVFDYSLIGCFLGAPTLIALAITALIVALLIYSIWDKWFWQYRPRQAVMFFTTGIFAAILGTLLKRNSALIAGICGLLIHLSWVYTSNKFHDFMERRRWNNRGFFARHSGR